MLTLIHDQSYMVEISNRFLMAKAGFKFFCLMTKFENVMKIIGDGNIALKGDGNMRNSKAVLELFALTIIGL